MTPLRQRMLGDMQLRGLSARTQEAYVHAVCQLARHFHKSPDLVTDEELREYFLHLTQVQRYARTTVTIALCGIKFFVEQSPFIKRVLAKKHRLRPVRLTAQALPNSRRTTACVRHLDTTA